MDDRPKYVILGRGRWAQRMSNILAGENRHVANLADIRRRATETKPDYRARLSSDIADSGAQIAWLCVPPGAHVLPMLEACADAGVHAVAEKPWFGTPEETRAVEALANENGIRIGIHYEYCLLDEVEAWRKNLAGDTSLTFGGTFHLARPNHLGITALDNLGSHLLSIRAYALTEAGISAIDCRYETPDRRVVWIEKEGKRIESLDLLANKQPIIQRFIAKFEAALDGAAFELDLGFALRVADEIAALKK